MCYPAYQTILEMYTPSRIFAGGHSATLQHQVNSRQFTQRTTSQNFEASVSSADMDTPGDFNTWRLKGQKLINMSTL